ncbi:hypothetical protein DHEL01_v209589 [Diaporthe helianthi]|uniref:BZIP domain-containing protein n=1 Tax=Diaporthe helianthi TaxID=158607 RepID=A0A2P5HP53_DIAHE|nr:hypothetical protein DHEL01_v209589 [Diaporthe helianthi]
MMSQPGIHGGENEAQPFNSHSSDFQDENTSVLPVEVCSDTNALDDIYASSTFKSPNDYYTSLQSNSWNSEAPAGVDPPLTGVTSSPPILTHSISTSHYDTEPIPERIPTCTSDEKTYGSQLEKRTEFHDASPHHKKNKSDGEGSYQETAINSNASDFTTDLTCSPDSATTPTLLPPDASLYSADIEAKANARRSRSSRPAGSTGEKRRAGRQPTPEPAPSTQRVRNRMAANKFRIKTKAAVAELEAMEREESARHEQLSMAVRSLQADVFALKSEILLHGGCGDGLVQNYLNKSVRSLADECGPGQVSHNSSFKPILVRR